MAIRPIRTASDYDKAVARARVLMKRNDKQSIDELDVLQALIERWERINHALPAASPSEAIRFRMEQAGLKPRDLIPYLGTKSRVSEVLNGHRQLTVDQIRALSHHLSIPVASLVGPARHEPASRPSVASAAAADKLRTWGVIKADEGLSAFVTRTAKHEPAVAMLRKSRTDRTNAKTDLGALEAWCGAVLVQAERLPIVPCGRFDPMKAARQIAQLSLDPDWPSKVPGELARFGVGFVILEHLPGTYLDGAAMCRGDGRPVIALTLRHDRIDNFWFTLLHEFAHVCCHLGSDRQVILDDMEVVGEGEIEAQADAFASEALIPSSIWEEHVSERSTVEDLVNVSRQAGVHPAIAAGRWQHRFGDYRRFSRLLGRGKVKLALSRR